ncbi:MAG: DUF1566 domain-containing protein [Candidatus Electrothrix sp. AUS1_2]|nr:DUF1566 domain-containing protein [Candidatus Electrothrix sp. AUS1_2]
MRTCFLIFFCVFFAAIVHAEQFCKPESIPASTPDSQLVDNGNGTVTDSITGLMWKKCLEGLSGDNCESGTPEDYLTWLDALQRPDAVNDAGGFAGYRDWRLPNINELVSLVEEQCSDPAINLNRFPNTPSSDVWSGSPHADLDNSSWCVSFSAGSFFAKPRRNNGTVRLVRGGK